MVRGVRIDQKTDDDIKIVRRIGNSWGGTWHRALCGNTGQQKYNPSSIRHKIWKTGNLLDFRRNIEKIINKVIINEDISDNTNYTLGQYNLLMNGDMYVYDGQPQKSYPPRLLV